VGARLVVQLDLNGNQRTALAGQIGVELREGFRVGTRGGPDRAVGRLAKPGFEPADDGYESLTGAEMPKQKLAAGSLGAASSAPA
jgi:hypothetical protein